MARHNQIAYCFDDQSGHGYAEVTVDEGDDVINLHVEDEGPQAVQNRLNLDEARGLYDALGAAIQVAEYNNRN